MYLDCDYNRLTVLDISKNTALARLICSYNQLTAKALNALFSGLPAYSGVIFMEDNPGSDTCTCNRSIATKKGWEFRYKEN
jgi:hypothetical protein